MNKLILFACFLFVFNNFHAQNISGIINNYAPVTSINGSTLSITSATAFSAGDLILLIQMKGAVIDTTNGQNFGDITSMSGAGTFEFQYIQSMTATKVNCAAPLLNTYDVLSGYVQIVRVPRYCTANVTGVLTCAPWNYSLGGVLAFEAGTLNLNADINVNARGFWGGDFATSTFGCDNGNFKGIAGTDGGQKGESISQYIPNYDGAKGKQANGGGGGNTGNSGGGGGANGGAGGLGGNQYSGCSGIDDRGIGGMSIGPAFSTLILGGGGGGGYRDNGYVATKGGSGGGIIYIKANVINANNHSISSNGGSVTLIADAEGAGGGGAGGTIFIECNSINGNLKVNANGGTGGSNFNNVFVSDCHGTGGGGGGGVFAFSGLTLPPGVTFSSLGGAAGTVNNPSSSCFGTTNGAGPGGNGISLPGLPTAPLVFNIPVLSATPDNTICSGESVSLTVSGASTYSWSTGSTGTLVMVSPTISSSYTVSGILTGTNACSTSTITSITVLSCTGIRGFNAKDGMLKMYPNPASSQLFIETGTPVEISIYDGTGKMIMERALEAGQHELNLDNYAPGVYLVKATDDKGSSLGKLIKTN